MSKQHYYTLTTHWTGNQGTGTSSYRNYTRSYVIAIEDKAEIQGSSDPQFLGDKHKHNPEELLLASLSSCHMLWYLHICAERGVVVVAYADNATGLMEETPNGSGRFTEVLLQPVVTVANATMVDQANALHVKANEMCFIANSVNFAVRHKPICKIAELPLI